MMDEKTDILKVLEQGNTIQIKPQGISMEPLLVAGRDEAILRPISEKDIRRGQVLLYRGQRGVLTLHRVWKVKEEGVYFVGDSQTDVEGPVSVDLIYGTMCGFVRKGKEHSTDELSYRLVYGMWLFLRPVRSRIAYPITKLKRNK